ncbi:MAG: hypothetical protein V4443_10285 [Pseudomonadota bacterium]
MNIVMDMSSYEVEKSAMEPAAGLKHDAGRPYAAVALQQLTPVAMQKKATMPATLAKVNVELWLSKMEQK